MPQLIKDYSRRESWYTNYVASPSRLTVETAGSCPYYPQDPVIRFELRDGERSTYDEGKSPPRERIQLQHDSFFRAGLASYNGVTTNGEFCVSWAAKFDPGWPNAASIDRWQITVQLHGQTLDQAIWMHEVRAAQTRFNHNAGRSTPRYSNYSPIDLGVWHHYAVHWKHSTGNDGWFKCYRDGVLISQWSGGPTDVEADPAYLCVGIYRNAAVDGTAVWRLCGLRVHNGYVPPNSIGSGSGTAGGDTPTPQPPDPQPPAALDPTLSVVGSPSVGQSYVGSVPFRVDVANAPVGAQLFVGISPSVASTGAVTPNAGANTGTLTLPNNITPGLRWFYATLQNSAGVKLAEQTFVIGVSPGTSPPPITPPTDPGGVPTTPPVVDPPYVDPGSECRTTFVHKLRSYLSRIANALRAAFSHKT